jgi:hypothetical protein
MENWVFIAAMAFILAIVFAWGFKTLPGEKWQVLCTLPVKKERNGRWQGVNLTYYGLFNAMALCAAVLLVVVLTGAAGIDPGALAVVVCTVLGCCLPASRIMARWVEKKAHTFSVGAASFLGIVAAPWLVRMVASLLSEFAAVPFDAMAVVAALTVGYTLGEGIGRLACISFGCCYGKPMDQMPPMIQRYFSWIAFTYRGDTKKIAYAHGLADTPIFAIQAVTAVLYSLGALAGTYLFLAGRQAGAFLLCIVVTQGWRFLSEFYRSDYRGKGRISRYQLMSLATLPYAILILPLFHASGDALDVTAGLRTLWNPAVILFIQALWVMMFARMGRSRVTGSNLTLHVL